MKKLAFLTSMLASTTAIASPPSGGDWVQIWNDEFSGSSLNSSKWDTSWLRLRADTGSFKAYHRAATNARVGGGVLSHVYTRPNTATAYSAYATTNGIFGTTYGYFEIRMQITNQSGSQSAFWMMPYNDANGDGRSGLPENNTVNNSAVDGAEIDIMESKGLPNDYSAGIICDNYASAPPPCSDTRDDTISASGFRSGYKTWALNWTPTKLEFIYEGQVKHTLTASNRIVHVPERLILSGAANASLASNLAVGAENDSGKIDWIRVHKDNEMDWGSGYFKVINRDTGDALTAGSSFVDVTAYSAGDDDQLWQITKDSSCPGDVYSIKSKGNNKRAWAEPMSINNTNPDALMSGGSKDCEWAIEFDSNSDGKDYYLISSYDAFALANLYLRDPGGTNAKIGASPGSNNSQWQIIWVED